MEAKINVTKRSSLTRILLNRLTSVDRQTRGARAQLAEKAAGAALSVVVKKESLIAGPDQTIAAAQQARLLGSAGIESFSIPQGASLAEIDHFLNALTDKSLFGLQRKFSGITFLRENNMFQQQIIPPPGRSPLLPWAITQPFGEVYSDVSWWLKTGCFPMVCRSLIGAIGFPAGVVLASEISSYMGEEHMSALAFGGSALGGALVCATIGTNLILHVAAQIILFPKTVYNISRNFLGKEVSPIASSTITSSAVKKNSVVAQVSDEENTTSQDDYDQDDGGTPSNHLGGLW